MSRPDEELEKAMALSSKAIGSSGFCEWAEEAYREALAQQGSPEDVAMRKTEAATSPDLVERAVVKALKTAESGRCYGQGNSFFRDVLLVAWRDLSGLSNRDIGKRLGHADGATVGKRFKQLRHDSELYAKVHTVIAGIKRHSIANCKA